MATHVFDESLSFRNRCIIDIFVALSRCFFGFFGFYMSVGGFCHRTELVFFLYL